MTETWLVLRSGEGGAAENMAWDEALHEACAQFGGPVLRFYGWHEPAATFGYSQRFADVTQWTRLRPLIRRPTGGGLVPHDADWTYSLVFPPGHPWHQLKATESYERVHDWIRRAFAKIGVAAELSPCCQPKAPGRCFAGAERFDVLSNGRKVAGAAQRRNQAGLLIQGSVQPPAAGERRAWEEAMLESAPGWDEVRWQEFKPDEALLRRIAELARIKYSQASHNQKR